MFIITFGHIVTLLFCPFTLIFTLCKNVPLILTLLPYCRLVENALYMYKEQYWGLLFFFSGLIKNEIILLIFLYYVYLCPVITDNNLGVKRCMM